MALSGGVEWDIVETSCADRDDAGLAEGASERLNNYNLLELLGKGMVSECLE
jgi:hypothetical protein